MIAYMYLCIHCMGLLITNTYVKCFPKIKQYTQYLHNIYFQSAHTPLLSSWWMGIIGQFKIDIEV